MKKLLLIMLAMVALQLNAQNVEHYSKMVKELSSKKYMGRGYAYDGANKAGKYIEKEFQKAGADEVICQPFKLNINTFPGKMSLKVDGKKLTPGIDFTMREFSQRRFLPTSHSQRTRMHLWFATSGSPTSTAQISSVCRARSAQMRVLSTPGATHC